MSNDYPYSNGGSAGAHEADAVCQECGTVNPEGTLMCRQCGNNLREQRLRRTAEAQHLLNLPDEKPRKREYVYAALTVIVIVLLLGFVLSADRIANWMIASAADGAAATEDLWTGPDAGILNALQRRLEKSPVSADLPRVSVFVDGEIDLSGRFIIESPGASGNPVVGSAITEQSGPDVYFVALFANGVEVRGLGTVDGAGNVQCFDASMLQDGEKTGAFGYARPAPDGSLTCNAQTDESDAALTATLHRVQD